MQPFIVMCAPNGARKTKDDHPDLPITPAELADCAESLIEAGASIIHVHVRDDDDAHSLDVEQYRNATAAIRGRVGDNIVIQVTTEACGKYLPEQQMAMVRELKPEAVSVALREICPDSAAEAAAGEFYAWMCDEKIIAQHILYSRDEVARFEALRLRGVIPDRKPFVLFVLGRYASNLTGDVGELDAFIQEAAAETVWAVCCFGNTEHDAVVAAANAGGHARVGFENNQVLPGGAPAGSNADLVALAVNAARTASRDIATADDVRSLFSPA